MQGPQRHKRVLVVDDEASIVRMVTASLEKSGYIVETAASGDEALQTLREFWPDILVLDVMMPRLNGYRVSRMVKLLAKTNALRAPKIILVTSRNLGGDPEREEVMGGFSMADGTLYKPFYPKDLLDKIKAVAG